MSYFAMVVEEVFFAPLVRCQLLVRYLRALTGFCSWYPAATGFKTLWHLSLIFG